MRSPKDRAIRTKTKATNDTQSDGKSRWLVCTLTASLLVVVTGIYITHMIQFEDHPQQDVIFSTRNVTRRTLQSPHVSYRQIAEERVPVILKNSVAKLWKASKLFTTEFLAKKLPKVYVYTQQSKRSFITFHDNKPLEDFVMDERWEDYNIKTNITIAKLLRWEESEPEDLWRYFSQDITQLTSVFPDVFEFIQPLKPLVLSEDSVQINLWIGRRGIITHTHYDATYNFFVQLQGRKRFTLFPPNQTMYLYPCLHPHYGHSQVDIHRPDLRKYPLFYSSEAVVADVGPGDMLVVPPYWYHHVETMEESVSVNVWSDAPEYYAMNEIYSQPIPFEENWGPKELAMATCVYSKLIFEGIIVYSDFQIFLQDSLISERYYPLVSAGKLITNDSCLKELQEMFSTVSLTEKVSYYRPLLERGVNTLKLLFAQITDKSTAKICIGNYIEHLIHRAVGLECLYGLLTVCSTWS